MITYATYSIAITNPTGTGTSAGFIDPQTVEQYGLGSGVTLLQAENKVRGNVRQLELFQAIGALTNFNVKSVTVTGGSATTEPSAITYVLEFEKPGALYIVRNGSPLTADACIKQLIAETLCLDQTHRREVYEPGGAVYIMEDLVVGKLGADAATVAALITITAV